MTADVNEEEAIRWFVFGHEVDASGMTLKSCLRAALQDARALTSRDTSTGEPANKITPSWPGALLYLIVLEQIGKCIEPAGATTPANERGPVQRALLHFAPELEGRERAALYALRNAFAHDFSLASEPRGVKLGKTHPLRHRFHLDGAPGPLVRLPAVGWNGRYDLKQTKCATVVSLRALGDLVERIVTTIEAAANAGTLRLMNERTPEEVVSRFTFAYQEPPAELSPFSSVVSS